MDSNPDNAANNRPQVEYTPKRLVACNALAGVGFVGDAFKAIGIGAGGIVGPGVTAVGIATAQPEILATGITVTAVGGVSYVGGAVLKGVSNIALNHFCLGLFCGTDEMREEERLK